MEHKFFTKTPHFWSKEAELEYKLHIVYMELRNILSMYENTDSYNHIPDEEDAAMYLKMKFKKIHIMVDLLFEKTEWKDKMQNIVSEVEYFVKQYEVPGVVLRWKQLNPNLLFFDCAFQIQEELPEEYLKCQRGLTGYKLGLYPDEELIQQRKLYFEHARCDAAMSKTTFSEDKLFEMELLKTLDIVFENDFVAK